MHGVRQDRGYMAAGPAPGFKVARWHRAGGHGCWGCRMQGMRCANGLSRRCLGGRAGQGRRAGRGQQLFGGREPGPGAGGLGAVRGVCDGARVLHAVCCMTHAPRTRWRATRTACGAPLGAVCVWGGATLALAAAPSSQGPMCHQQRRWARRSCWPSGPKHTAGWMAHQSHGPHS